MLTSDELKRLSGVGGPCLTIYQALRDDYSQVTKPETRIVAAVQEAEGLLAKKGFSQEDQDEFLRPIRKIALNTDWTGRTGSLVVFRAPGFTMANFWPDTLLRRVHLAEEFLVLPLLPACAGAREFWLLGLSTKGVRLFRGSHAGMSEVPLPEDVPKGIAEFGGFDQPDHSLRSRNTAGPSVGRMKGVQFGTSPSAHEAKAGHLQDFFKRIDRGIHATLAADPQPLILAGVSRELTTYGKINSYAPVVQDGIHGSPDSLGTHALYARALELMSAYSAQAAEPTAQEIEQAADRGLLIRSPASIIDAARAGQIGQLLVCPDAPGFGEREQIINWVSLATIRNSGKVSFLSAPGLIAETGFAAIARYRPAEQPTPEVPKYAANVVT